VEFLLDTDGSFAFLEMNTRIQVEHPVTELTTGIDLVREQILVAGGAPLSFTAGDVVPRGHAIECRINAEDPGRGFAPSPGRIERFHAPGGMGIRVDSATESGETIHPTYDSLIAKVVAWGRDRGEAADRMQGALAELEIIGPPTTRDFHLRVLENPAWRAGIVTTTFIDRHPEVIPPPANAEPNVAPASGEPVELVTEVEGRRFNVRVHGAFAAGPTRVATQRRPNKPRQADALGTAGDGKLLRSPIQGTVVRVNLQPGDQVQRGQTVCVVEAMKMENDVTAHRDGAVISIAAAPGAAVRIGDPLAEIG
jgi:acetyl-CoA/propionyl-CoA carboxylase biotin carboxyl carrier protein